MALFLTATVTLVIAQMTFIPNYSCYSSNSCYKFESLSNPSVPNYIKQLFEAKNSKNRTYGTTRCILQLQLPSFNTIKYGRNCIRNECPKMLNSLSSTLKLYKSNDSFIEAFCIWNGPQSCIYVSYRRSSHPLRYYICIKCFYSKKRFYVRL